MLGGAGSPSPPTRQADGAGAYSPERVRGAVESGPEGATGSLRSIQRAQTLGPDTSSQPPATHRQPAHDPLSRPFILQANVGPDHSTIGGCRTVGGRHTDGSEWEGKLATRSADQGTGTAPRGFPSAQGAVTYSPAAGATRRPCGPRSLILTGRQCLPWLWHCRRRRMSPSPYHRRLPAPPPGASRSPRCRWSRRSRSR